jgi:hypothetical protein
VEKGSGPQGRGVGPSAGLPLSFSFLPFYCLFKFQTHVFNLNLNSYFNFFRFSNVLMEIYINSIVYKFYSIMEGINDFINILPSHFMFCFSFSISKSTI